MMEECPRQGGKAGASSWKVLAGPKDSRGAAKRAVDMNHDVSRWPQDRVVGS